MHLSLRILAILFIALVVLQSVLGGALFIVLAGWSPQEVATYYSQKSFHGLLETLAPHTLFISIALMGTLHFLGFIQTINEKQKQLFIHVLFALFLIDQLSPIGISLGMDFLASVKLIAFIGFETALAAVWLIIFRHSLAEA